MCSCGATLDDVPQRISWRALTSFVRNLDVNSATFARMHPDRAGWTREAYLLADVFDAINAAATCLARSKHFSVTAPPPHSRPKVGHDHGAVTIAEFDKLLAATAERAKAKAREVSTNG